MPISTNAPFNEFGFSMVQRDLEQLYLALSAAGSGGPGDGQTQDQSAVSSQDSDALLDLSAYATIAYADSLLAGIDSASALYLHAAGTVTPSSGTFDAAYSSQSGNMSVSGNDFVAPFNGIYTVISRYGTTVTGVTTGVGFQVGTTITAPYGLTSSNRNLETIAFTVGGVAPTYSNRASGLTPIAVWSGYLAAGDTISITHEVSDSTKIGTSYNQLHISGVTCNP